MPERDWRWERWVRRIQSHYADAEGAPLFRVADPPNQTWFDVYLAALPEDQRQHHNCHACRDFLNTYAGLVTLDDKGRQKPLLWQVPDTAHIEDYDAVDVRMTEWCTSQPLTGVFYTPQTVWGRPETHRPVGEDWTHLAIAIVHPAHVYHDALKTSAQAMAEKVQDFNNLTTALGLYTPQLLQRACALLADPRLHRRERVLGAATWLYDLQAALQNTRYTQRKVNLLWRAVATAPVGYAHPRANMLGALLADLQNPQLDEEAVIAAFNARMDPLAYQRPQAAPAPGNVRRAEEIVAALGIEPSLKRRFATLKEVQKLWTPDPLLNRDLDERVVFKDIQDRALANGRAAKNEQRLTWTQFAALLPEFISLRFRAVKAHYCAMVTADKPDAPPILQWDQPDCRNPFNWYSYANGSEPQRWNLREGYDIRITGVVLRPHLWRPDARYEHLEKAVMFCLQDCRDTKNSALGLFPETLRAELHEVRKWVEDYSHAHKLPAPDAATQLASGVRLTFGAEQALTLIAYTLNDYRTITISGW